MATDVYVMPLWRLKAGDFTSPMEEALGIEPTVISLADLPSRQPPWYVRVLAKFGVVEIVHSEPEPEPELGPEERRARAQQEVGALKEQLTKVTGTTVDWPDTGGIHYKRQFREPITLRAFAAWLNHRDALPEFVYAPEGNYYKHPVWQIAKPPHRRFSTLIRHSMHSGYFLPTLFDGLHYVEPFTAWGREFHHHVASTQTILAELAELLPAFESIPSAKAEDKPNPVADAQWYAEELQRICTLSMEHRLPVIFYG